MNVDLNAAARGPCAGIRVLDFSTVVAGPMCTMTLGDLGADVIKVEPPRGDTTRSMGPPFKSGISAMFAQFNRNKRGIVLDLKTAAGQTAARRLARAADVMVTNFRPGVAERLGIDYPAVAATNPRLVYLAISGFGPDGPYAMRPAYDTVVQGLTGHMPIQGGANSPQLVLSLVADKSTALTGVYAVLAALLARERGGRGQLIQLPMIDAFAAFMLPDLMLRHTFLPSDEWQHLPEMAAAIHRTWETADGHVVIMTVEDAQFRALCRVLGRDDLLNDQRYGSLRGRIAHVAELFGTLEAELRKWPTAMLVARASAEGAPVAPVNDVRAFLADPQVTANRTVFEVDDEKLGTVRYLRSPARFHDTPPSLRRHPPHLGEHTCEVLHEHGFTDDEIAGLAANSG